MDHQAKELNLLSSSPIQNLDQNFPIFSFYKLNPKFPSVRSLCYLPSKTMQSPTLCGNYGLPLCVSGITQRLILSREMADHEQRRKGVMKKRRPEARTNSTQMGTERNNGRSLRENREGEEVKELIAFLQDLGWSNLSHTAKAA